MIVALNIVFLGIGLIVWIGLAIYLLIDTRKKVKLLAEKSDIYYPFQCVKCHNIKEYSYAKYMQIVKNPRNKFTTFTSIRNQYLFHCEQCNKSHYQEILYGRLTPNTKFIQERRKIVIIFLLKEFALAFLVTAILRLSGVIPQ